MVPFPRDGHIYFHTVLAEMFAVHVLLFVTVRQSSLLHYAYVCVCNAGVQFKPEVAEDADVKPVSIIRCNSHFISVMVLWQ